MVNKIKMMEKERCILDRFKGKTSAGFPRIPIPDSKSINN
jgi:hypothetical protein